MASGEHYQVGYDAIMQWSRGASFDATLIPSILAKYRTARDLLPAGPSRETEDGKIAALQKLQTEHASRARNAGAGKMPAIHPNPRDPQALSKSLKQGHPIGSPAEWKNAEQGVEAARAAARLDLRDKGIHSPTPRELDKHARAKLQARININARQYTAQGKRGPRWLSMMRAAVKLLKKAIRSHPKEPRSRTNRTKQLFPQRARWDRKSSAIAAARKLARKRFGKMKRGVETDTRAAELLQQQMAADAATGRAWYKAAADAVAQLLGTKAAQKRAKNPPIKVPVFTERDVVDLTYEQKYEGRKLRDEEKIAIDNAMQSIPGLAENLRYRVNERWEREDRARRDAMGRIRQAEQGTRAEIRDAEEGLLEAMRDNPALVAERIRWVLNGTHGHGEMKMAYDALMQRGARASKVARLTQLIGAFEWSVPIKRVTSVWKRLTADRQQALERAIWSDVEEWAREELAGHGTGFGRRAAEAVGITRTGAAQRSPVAPPAPAPAPAPASGEPSASEAGRRLRAQRKKNASAGDAKTLADQFVNGDVPKDQRLPVTRNKTERIVFPDKAVDIGELVAIEYVKDRPGVGAKFFIHKMERKPFPRVFVEHEGTIELYPSPERQFNKKGATGNKRIEVFDLEPTGFTRVPDEVADGGELTKVWVRVPRGTIDVDGKSLPFTVTEIVFPANSRPRVDFTGDLATISYTRDAWAALPPSKRVMWQYQGHNPTTKAGHGF